MDGNRHPMTQQQIAGKLLADLRLREDEWCRATDGNRDFARQRFINALEVFNRLVVHGDPPK